MKRLALIAVTKSCSLLGSEIFKDGFFHNIDFNKEIQRRNPSKNLKEFKIEIGLSQAK